MHKQHSSPLRDSLMFHEFVIRLTYIPMSELTKGPLHVCPGSDPPRTPSTQVRQGSMGNMELYYSRNLRPRYLLDVNGSPVHSSTLGFITLAEVRDTRIISPFSLPALGAGVSCWSYVWALGSGVRCRR